MSPKVTLGLDGSPEAGHPSGVPGRRDPARVHPIHPCLPARRVTHGRAIAPEPTTARPVPGAAASRRTRLLTLLAGITGRLDRS